MKFVMYCLLLACSVSCAQQNGKEMPAYQEQHRPQVHFSPKEKWMNDPNGMIFYNNQYHLFYQYYPDSTVWGPMHWGHATSKDLIHWTHQPIALYPDSLGYIFSGSVVADLQNTSGFGKDGQVPLVAIFTHHNPKGERAKENTYQTQSIAYSLDEGKTWTKYAGNPVVQNPGIRDFRDPKVIWFEEGKKWVMTLATKDRVTFFSSKNLKEWVKESEFGETVGAHGGVWECPELFPMNYQNEKIWVLLVSINPGGPNKGSATQYFTGKFDGRNFTPFQTDTRWVDYGPDDYAGVTWSNTGDRKIFIGWMSNWQYATRVPTEKWRSAMTMPRDLGLEKSGEKYLITSRPVPESAVIDNKTTSLSNVTASDALNNRIGKLEGPLKLSLNSDKIEDFSVTLSNDAGEKVIIGYDKAAGNYFIDRTSSGKVSFQRGFAGRHTAPRLAAKEAMDMTLIIDDASVELFADGGLSVMTSIFFPNTPYNHLSLQAADNFKISSLQYNKLKSIWR